MLFRSSPQRQFSPTGAHRGAAQRRYEVGGLVLKVFLGGLNRSQQALQVPVGCFPPPFHVVDALGIALEGFGERSDQGLDSFPALVQVPNALSAQRLQSLSRQLQESLVVAFERLARQALESLAQAGAGLVKLVLLFFQLLALALEQSLGLNSGPLLLFQLGFEV